VCRHKEVRRDSGEWKWVRMGARGCIDTHQTQNKANRDTDRPAGRNFGKGMGGKLLKKDGTATDQMGELWGCKGLPGTPPMHYIPPTMHARKEEQEKNITIKITVHYKGEQNAKRDKTTLNVPKKIMTKEKGTENVTQHQGIATQKQKGGKNRRKEARTAQNGDILSPKTCNNKQCTIRNAGKNN